jgi:hypothetical protein
VNKKTTPRQKNMDNINKRKANSDLPNSSEKRTKKPSATYVCVDRKCVPAKENEDGVDLQQCLTTCGGTRESNIYNGLYRTGHNVPEGVSAIIRAYDAAPAPLNRLSVKFIDEPEWSLNANEVIQIPHTRIRAELSATMDRNGKYKNVLSLTETASGRKDLIYIGIGEYSMQISDDGSRLAVVFLSLDLQRLGFSVRLIDPRRLGALDIKTELPIARRSRIHFEGRKFFTWTISPDGGSIFYISPDYDSETASLCSVTFSSSLGKFSEEKQHIVGDKLLVTVERMFFHNENLVMGGVSDISAVTQGTGRIFTWRAGLSQLNIAYEFWTMYGNMQLIKHKTALILSYYDEKNGCQIVSLDVQRHTMVGRVLDSQIKSVFRPKFRVVGSLNIPSHSLRRDSVLGILPLEQDRMAVLYRDQIDIYSGSGDIETEQKLPQQEQSIVTLMQNQPRRHIGMSLMETGNLVVYSRYRGFFEWTY